ncbi:MAG: cytochrome c oxidase subunit 3 [Anaerolineae bacterium]|nr:cytochrome c oxidase subunit 3 [Anaerolineae bacterium]
MSVSDLPSQRVLEKQLSRQELQELRNKRTGLTIFQISWILVFVCLIIVNWQLRNGQVSWPPPGVEAPSPLLPTVATLGLLVSVWFVRRGLRAIRADEQAAFFRYWRAALGLAVAFVAIVAFDWVRIPYTGIYSDVFRMMTGFHEVHALAIGTFMGMIYRGARAGNYGPGNFWPVEGAAGLWYFVVFAWILFYAVLYLI